MMVNKYGLGIQNMVTSSHKKIESSQRASVELVNAVTGKSEFSTTIHVIAVREQRSQGQKAHNKSNKIKFIESVHYVYTLIHRILIRLKNMCSWLTARGDTVTGTVLLVMEFHYLLFSCYNIPPSPPTSRKKLTVVPNLSRYIIHLTSKMTDLSLHVKMKFVMSSSTS